MRAGSLSVNVDCVILSVATVSAYQLGSEKAHQLYTVSKAETESS